MRRLQTLFKIVLVAAVMIVAAGTPVAAKPPTKIDTPVVRIEKRNFFFSFLQTVRLKLTRYAMAAN